jgi:hypothetical protein
MVWFSREKPWEPKSWNKAEIRKNCGKGKIGNPAIIGKDYR